VRCTVVVGDAAVRRCCADNGIAYDELFTLLGAAKRQRAFFDVQGFAETTADIASLVSTIRK
jgi:hypothetical protein